ncbi:UvrB/UvrC motif-containing protein [Rubritalea sp.]|uniref:UvrB/UvrC motif-containing protein n=1 Tax=Rubritalea sp. TaxID=2109375 RepID=UPI003EF81BFB
MKCELCNNEASVFYTQAVQGGQKKICLCESCAEERGLTDPGAFSMVDILMDETPQQAQQSAVVEVAEQCPHCEFTLEDYRKVGRLGCSQCYTAFRGEILPVLAKMHQGAKHQGKVPSGMAESLEFRQKLENLKQTLEQAISNEKFEEAAKIRDSIKELEAE